MKLITRLGILATATLLGVVSPAAAQQGAAGETAGAPGRGPGMERAPMPPPPPGAEPRDQLKRAGATDAQIATLTEFDFAQQEKRIDLRAKAEKAELALHRQMQAATADEKSVLDAVDALNQANGEMRKLDVMSMLKHKQVLGEDVLRKLHEMTPPPEARDRRAPGRGPGQGQGRGQGREDFRAPPQDGPRAGAMNENPRPRNDGGSRQLADAPRPPPEE